MLGEVGFAFRDAGRIAASVAVGEFAQAKKIFEEMEADAVERAKKSDERTKKIMDGASQEPALKAKAASGDDPDTIDKAQKAEKEMAALQLKHDKELEANTKLVESQNEKFTRMREQADAYSQTEIERENARYERQVADIERERAVLENKNLLDLASQAKFDAAKEAMLQEHLARIDAAEKKSADNKKKGDIAIVNFGHALRTGEYAAAMSLAQNMTAGIASHSRAAFNINKVAGIGTAIMNTFKGVSGVLAEFPGPVGWALAATQAALGVAQVSAIRSTQFGGGGGGGGSIPSAAILPGTPVSIMPEPASFSPTLPTASAPVQTTQQLNITIIGAAANPDAPTISFNAAVAMIAAMNIAGENGHRLNTNLTAG